MPPLRRVQMPDQGVGAGLGPARGRPLAAHLIRPLRGHLPLKGKAFGRPQGSPLRRKRTGTVGSAEPGADLEPQMF